MLVKMRGEEIDFHALIRRLTDLNVNCSNMLELSIRRNGGENREHYHKGRVLSIAHLHRSNAAARIGCDWLERRPEVTHIDMGV